MQMRWSHDRKKCCDWLEGLNGHGGTCREDQNVLGTGTSLTSLGLAGIPIKMWNTEEGTTHEVHLS